MGQRPQKARGHCIVIGFCVCGLCFNQSPSHVSFLADLSSFFFLIYKISSIPLSFAGKVYLSVTSFFGFQFNQNSWIGLIHSWKKTKLNFFKIGITLRLFFFLEQFKVYSKIERKVQRSPIYLFSRMHITSSISQSFSRMVHSFVEDAPTLTCHKHPKSVVYIRVHFCWCTFYGFKPNCNDIYSLLWYTEYFRCSKYRLTLFISSATPRKSTSF